MSPPAPCSQLCEVCLTSPVRAVCREVPWRFRRCLTLFHH